MARGAVERLEVLLNSNTRLLELGSGASTVWYGRRAGHVTSLESSPVWADRTRAATASLGNVDLVFGALSESAPARLAGSFDVVIVDHEDEPGFTRVDALRLLSAEVHVAVLDDSDRATYSQADEIMRDWTAERFVSFRAHPLVPTETTVYSR